MLSAIFALVSLHQQVAPQLDIVNGALTDVRTGKPAELHGLNWFGWETSTPGFDGLWVRLSLVGKEGDRGVSKGCQTNQPQQLMAHSLAVAVCCGVCETYNIHTDTTHTTTLPPSTTAQAYNDNELAPNTSIKASDARRLGFNFWEKRTMTNDFATVVHRMKSLGELGAGFKWCA